MYRINPNGNVATQRDSPPCKILIRMLTSLYREAGRIRGSMAGCSMYRRVWRLPVHRDVFLRMDSSD
jgi:hypothetical protein